MKFLKEDGTVEEGTPLTDKQVALRENFEQYLHIVVCRHDYHSLYQRRPCEIAATFLIGGHTIDELAAEIDRLTPKNVPEPEEVPEPVHDPIPEPVPAAPINDDDIAF